MLFKPSSVGVSFDKSFTMISSMLCIAYIATRNKTNTIWNNKAWFSILKSTRNITRRSCEMPCFLTRDRALCTIITHYSLGVMFFDACVGSDAHVISSNFDKFGHVCVSYQSHVLHLAVIDNKVFGLKLNHNDCLALMRNAIILIHMYKQACRICQNRIITSMTLWWRVDVSYDFVTRSTAKRADCLKIAPTMSSCGLHALVNV